MAVIRVRVGAQLDAGAVRVFDPLIVAAGRARAAIAREGKAATAEFVGGYRSAPAHARKAYDEIAKAAEDAAAKQIAASKRVTAEQAKELAKQTREVEASLRKNQASGRRVLHHTAQTLTGVVRSGVGVAGSVARGAGVDLDVGSQVTKVVKNEKLAQDIANSGYMEGAKGPAGQRQSGQALEAEGRAAAKGAAMDSSDVLEGLQKFVGLTSDLQSGRDILADMARLSKSTGSSMNDMMSEAAEMSNRLGDIPDKGKAISQAMRVAASAGKLGSIEARDAAKVMGGVLASANRFKGDTSQTMGDLGALLQVTKKAGTKGGPAGAATAVSSFVADLTSKSGTKALDKLLAGKGGSDALYTDKTHSQLKALPEVMKILTAATGGDLKKISAAMPNKRSKEVLAAFGGVYREAEGKEKGSGAKAIEETFKAYGAKMSEAEIAKSLADAMNTTASKAELFNGRLEELAANTLPKLIPSLEKLADPAARVADVFASVVSWATENPGSAITAAIVASIAKAAIGEAAARALSGSLGSGAFAAGAAITIVTAAAIIHAAKQTQAEIGEVTKHGEEDVATVEKAAKTGVIGQEDLSRAQQHAEQARAEAEKGAAWSPLEALKVVSGYSLMSGMASMGAGAVGLDNVGTSFKETTDTVGTAMNFGALTEAMQRSEGATKQLQAAITSGVLKVQVVNQPGGGPAPGSTTGPVLPR